MVSIPVLEQVVVSYDPTRPVPVSTLIPYAKGQIRRFASFPVLTFPCYARNVFRIKALSRVAYMYVPRFSSYIRLLEVVDGAVQLAKRRPSAVPSVLNLSISYGPRPFSVWEPMNLATRAAAQRGILIVFAVGNDGPGENTPNPWSVAPWVVGVGAVDKEGKRLWESSSVGIPGDNMYHPTVVAHGIEVPVPDIGVSEPEKRHGSHTIWVLSGRDAEEPGAGLDYVTGTSFATAQVSRVCAYIVAFIEHLEFVYGELIQGDGYYGYEPYYAILRELQAQDIRRSMTSSPSKVKKLLEAMATPVEQCDTHQVGAGFVDDQVAIRYLKDFSARDFIRLCCNKETEKALDTWLVENPSPLVPYESIDRLIENQIENQQIVDLPII